MHLYVVPYATGFLYYGIEITEYARWQDARRYAVQVHIYKVTCVQEMWIMQIQQVVKAEVNIHIKVVM